MHSFLLHQTRVIWKFKIWLWALFISASASHASAQSVIAGKVTSEESKEGVPGVNIIVKGTNNGTITDVNGNFSINASADATLVFSSIGFLTTSVDLEGRTSLNVSLQTDVKQLQEVVVVAYGTQERKDVIGSVVKVDPQETENIPVGSFDSQLQGKVAGVQIVSNTGVPGESVNVKIRGATSINADNRPLYIVDGVFINGSSLQTLNTGGKATSPIADINPSDIESIEVLKDAEATALYGSRGANGVVIVTTKRGDFEQKPKISFNASYGLAKAAKLWDLTTGPEHAELVNEFYRNAYKDAEAAGNTTLMNQYRYVPFRATDDNPTASPAPRGLPEGQKTYDRLHKLFRTARLQNYDLSLTGGSKNTKFYIGGGYNRQEAIIRPIYFERASFKINLDQKVNDKIQVGVSNAITRTFRNQGRAGDGPAGGLLQAALHTPTYLSPFNEKGEPVGRAGFDNLTLLINNYDVNTVSLRYIGNLYAEAQILPDLKFRTSFGVDYNNYDESEYWKSFLISGGGNGSASSALTQFTSLLNEQTLSYKKKLSDKHTIGVLVGNTLQSDVLSRSSATGSGFPNNSYTIISSASVTSGSQSWSKNTLASFFSRVNYSYSDRYLFDFSIRADGSSKFGASNRWGYFPAAGVAWRAKNESFLKSVDFISDLKLRGSYGITGNQNGIGNFAAQGLWTGGANYQGSPGTAPLQLSNPNLKWERTRQINVGVDVSFLQRRIGVEFNVYDKYTTDVLLQIPLQSTTGFTSYWKNSAEISNKGFELAINTNNIVSSDFSWTTSFNIARNVNNIEKLENPIKYGSRDLILLKQGSPLYSFWVYKQLYVDPQTGNVVYDDYTKDGNITAADRQVYGSIWPKFFGGLTNNITFRGFDASVFLAFSYGNKVYNHNRFFGEAGGARDAARVIFKSNLKRWQKPGDITDVPRPDGVNVNNYRDGGSRWLEDGSYLRLRSLTVGYTLPTRITQKLGVETLRFYVIGTNLFLITKYKGLDPESSANSDQNQQGIDLGTPPQPRGVQVGLNLTL
jgi:TonB-linked SusC/RagA family outer membrane protein